jgi:hypothetical protein
LIQDEEGEKIEKIKLEHILTNKNISNYRFIMPNPKENFILKPKSFY